MPRTLHPELRRAIGARLRYYNEMGIYDFYRRPASQVDNEVAAVVMLHEEEDADAPEAATAVSIFDSGDEMSPRKASAVTVQAIDRLTDEVEEIAAKPEQSVSDPAKALKIIREE